LGVQVVLQENATARQLDYRCRLLTTVTIIRLHLNWGTRLRPMQKPDFNFFKELEKIELAEDIFGTDFPVDLTLDNPREIANISHLKATGINRHVLKPLCAKLGIPKGTTHSFRHGRVSLIVASRLPDKFIQSPVGQVDKKITSHYTHFMDEQNHEMVNSVLPRGQNSKLWSTVN
jgi:hypothetical protein